MRIQAIRKDADYDTEKFYVWVTLEELNDLIAANESRAYIDGMNEAESTNKKTE